MQALVHTGRALVAAALIAGLASGAAPLLAAPAPAPAAKTAPIVWPMTLASGGGTIVLSQPQVRSWPGYSKMTGVAAVGVTLPGTSAPVYGVLSFSSLASADVPSGLVSLVNPKVDATSWPTASQADAAALDAFLKTNLHLEGKPLLPLSLVLSSLPRADRPQTVPLKTNPPVIYVSQTPAVLVGFDGKPVFAPIAGTSLTYAVNTNWEIIHNPAAALYYVHSRAGWFASPGAAGPFTPTVAPASFASIPSTGPLSYVAASLKQPKYTGTVIPRVIVSTVPAALIAINGQPQFANVEGTQLRYVVNTNSDLFFSRDTLAWYVLLSGRWFSAANLNGPWTFASTRLPADFKKIPEDGPRGRVLVSVPGTTQAFYAVNAAQVPHVAMIDPATATIAVTYKNGKPVFEPVTGTPLRYAVNTATDVIQVDATHYFACADGVWYIASSPLGPWASSSYVPSVIYTIPESSPLYHVTFVHVYDAQGVALTAPLATPEPKPKATYQTFAPSQFSQGNAASYYNTATAGYYAGFGAGWGGYASGTGYYSPGYYGNDFWVSSLPTYGNYNDTTYARQQAQANNPRSAQLAPPAPVQGHGPRSVPGPGTNIYAAADGVYRFVQGVWQKNAAGDVWTPQTTVPDTLPHDWKARQDGYAGNVS